MCTKLFSALPCFKLGGDGDAEEIEIVRERETETEMVREMRGDRHF
jgi:hypothetical protein